jgi:transcriptional regulator with XRE-family HTH domain
MKIVIQSSDFGEKLKKIRRDKGLTQVQLSQISGISSRMIAHYETYVKMPPVNKVKKIAEALGVSADELIGISKKSKEQVKKEKISYRIMKRVKIIEKLPVRDQKAIFHFINSLVAKNKLKGKL